ncbi:TPA: ead/Ea22-like family protein [Citrobacter freundii]|nr:ead/Ea22-like family protein [Citrobacter freundii]HBB4768065.1 ead/Ea22-like family protein [Citrobacter freundii]
MTALNKYAALRQLAEESTQGEWWSDVVETDGEYGEGEERSSGYHSYAVYVGSESLLDMTNSTAACIHEEYDHDYHMAWDETAKRNAEFIAAANPSTVLALLDELETKEEQRANWFQMAQKLGEDLDAAEKRIAELEAREVAVKQFDDFQIVHYGGSEDYAKGYIDCQNNYNKALTAAGIGVKGE